MSEQQKQNEQIKKIIMKNQIGVDQVQKMQEKDRRPHFPVGPTHPNFKSSGVTLGVGIDLGNKNAKEVEKIFKGHVSTFQLELLKQAAQLKGQKAVEFVKKNKDKILLSIQSTQITFDGQFQKKVDTINRIFSKKQFAQKFKVNGATLLKNMSTSYKIVMYDSIYLGRNTTKTREQIIPTLVKIQNHEASKKDIQNLNKYIVNDMYYKHKERQKNISAVINKEKEGNSQLNDKVLNDISQKLNNATVKKLSNLLNSNEKIGGIDFGFDLNRTNFTGFFCGWQAISMKLGDQLSPNLKDLIVPLKIMYDDSIKVKNISISIDPHVPTDPNGPYQQKIYYPSQMEGTYYAQIMMEADFIMKQLKIGVDQNNKPFQYPANLKKIGLAFDDLIPYINNPKERTRQWIVIKDVEMVTSTSNYVDIGNIKMEILAKVQVIGPNGTLIDSDEQPSLHTQKFCQIFTKYYDLIAEEYAQFKIIKRLAKAAVIARSMYQRGVNVNIDLINTLFQLQKTDNSPKVIPRIANNINLDPKRTPLIDFNRQNPGQMISIVKMFVIGGCDLTYKLPQIVEHQIQIDQDKANKKYVPFLFQKLTKCSIQGCNQVVQNGFRALNDGKCSEHTDFRCGGCMKVTKYGESYLKLGDDRIFHVDCLKCDDCSQSIKAGFKQRDNFIYHIECLPKNIIGNCYICKQKVDENSSYFSMGDKYSHKECMNNIKCRQCSKPIPPQILKTINNQNYHNYCVKCHVCTKSILQNQFSITEKGFAHADCLPKYECSGCKKNITGQIVGLGNNKFYHPDCLKCFKCSRPLNGQMKIDNDSNLYHPDCI